MKSALTGLLCGLLLCGPALACHPCFVHRRVVSTVIAPAVPVVPVSTVFIAQFAPAYLPVPTFTVGAAGYGTAVPAGGYNNPGLSGSLPGAVPGTAPQTPQQPAQPPQPSSGANPPASENERILAILSALEARLTALEGKLPAAQPPPPPTKPAPKEGEKPGGAKEGRMIPGAVHQPLAGLGKCISCHRGQNAEGALDLSAGLEGLTAQQLARIVSRSANGSMPPRRVQNVHPPMTAAEMRALEQAVAAVPQTARK